jgi:glycosyltransferase involved in cell wall biosynthesis
VRVLHLIDPGSPGGGACTLQLLGDALSRIRSVHQEVALIGTAAHAVMAQRCGVQPAMRLAPSLRLAVTAYRSVRRWLHGREREAGPFDLLHAWTAQAAVLATMLGPTRPRVASLSVGPITGPHVPLFRGMIHRHPMSLLASSSAVAREYRTIGVDERLVSILPPAVDPDAVRPGDRAALRARWRIDEGTFVVGLLSEPLNWADAWIGANVIARAAATGRRVRLIAHPRAARRSEARHWLRSLRFEDVLILDEDLAEPWRIAAGLDAALLIGGELNVLDLSAAGSPWALLTGGGRRLRPLPGIMPLLWAMSAGVPVIAEASDAVRDILHDGVSGLLVNPRDINTAADRIVRLADDRTIAGRIGAAARIAVHDRFHVSAYCVRLKAWWEKLAAGPPAPHDRRSDEPPGYVLDYPREAPHIRAASHGTAEDQDAP